jgi:protein-L-isoaspartate(D-aspartate) O-methyltransferase
MKRELLGIGMTSQRTRDRLVARLRAQGIRDPRVLEVIAATPRHVFVDEALASRAYEDTALPIGHGQTISQPFVVARMTEALLAEGSPARVLEVGTGCGYQTAVLAQLVQRVYSVERIVALLNAARERLYSLGLHNVKLCHADGTWGWPDYGPYEGILVTAAPPAVPAELCAQLADGGRMVVPVGGQDRAQRLLLVRREGSAFAEEVLDLVSFVPLLGGTA